MQTRVVYFLGDLQVSLDHKIFQTIKAGSQAKITCDFKGKPESIQWSKEGSSMRHINTKSEGNSLIFIRASTKDAGTYICRALNKKGQQTSGKVRVSVTGRLIYGISLYIKFEQK